MNEELIIMAGLISHHKEDNELCLKVETNEHVDVNTNKTQIKTTQTENKDTIVNDTRNSIKDIEPVCYNLALDDEIRNRLNKLNGLSDLINSLERDFDEANGEFREILKCSTDRLSSIAKALGDKSIKQGRIYLDAELSVERSQNDCQMACLQFEQANKDHQVAKEAIKEAESKLKRVASINSKTTNGVIQVPNVSNLDFSKLVFNNESPELQNSQETGPSRGIDEVANVICDKDGCKNEIIPSQINDKYHVDQPNSNQLIEGHLHTDFDVRQTKQTTLDNEKDLPIITLSSSDILTNAATLSEELNKGIQKLIEAEKKRGLSERQHLDQANKLIQAQENLIRLKREHGPAIRKSQLYFEEARRFNAKLNTIKLKIDRLSENISAAKQAYAQTLNELERFSDELHCSGATTTSTSAT